MRFKQDGEWMKARGRGRYEIYNPYPDQVPTTTTRLQVEADPTLLLTKSVVYSINIYICKSDIGTGASRTTRYDVVFWDGTDDHYTQDDEFIVPLNSGEVCSTKQYIFTSDTGGYVSYGLYPVTGPTDFVITGGDDDLPPETMWYTNTGV